MSDASAKEVDFCQKGEEQALQKGDSCSKNYYSVDISGRSFYRLKAICPTDTRTQKGSVMWHCICECGNEVDVSYNELMYSNIRSCERQKKEHDAKLPGFLTHAFNTSLDMLKSEKPFSNNTTGVRGVYFVKGKWIAKIVFQKKAYYLGVYKDIGSATEARKRAEELLFRQTVVYYDAWKKKADNDPVWAGENPFDVIVSKKDGGELSVEYFPSVEEYVNKVALKCDCPCFIGSEENGNGRNS